MDVHFILLVGISFDQVRNHSEDHFFFHCDPPQQELANGQQNPPFQLLMFGRIIETDDSEEEFLSQYYFQIITGFFLTIYHVFGYRICVENGFIC